VTGLRWGAATDVGRVRTTNEDSVLASAPVFVVADGMGGHAAGEVASQVALAALRAALPPDARADLPTVAAAVQTSNREVYRRASADAGLRGMGTTMTGIVLRRGDDPTEERATVVNVGDSRTYVLRGGELRQVTRDHKYVEELVAAGEITAEEARIHPRRNIVTRALGIDPNVEVDTWELDARAGDRFLICSDGLFDEVDDTLIASVMASVSDPQRVADELVHLANDSGGRDNISVVVVDVTADDRDEGTPFLPPTPPPEQPEPVPVAASPAAPAPALGGWLDDEATLDAPTGAPLPPPPPEAALATATMPATSGPASGPRGGDGTPPRRRRRIGWRSVVFVIAVLAIVGVAIGGITYYGRTGYYVGFTGDRLALFKGHEGGLLWLQPTTETTYGLSKPDLSPRWQQRIGATITFSSRRAADEWYAALAKNPAAVPSLATTTTTTTAPPTTTTLPPTTTTVVVTTAPPTAPTTAVTLVTVPAAPTAPPASAAITTATAPVSGPPST
jgi:PPM family protein phosphatase